MPDLMGSPTYTASLAMYWWRVQGVEVHRRGDFGGLVQKRGRSVSGRLGGLCNPATGDIDCHQ
jgi:hypothetical protein